MQILSKSKIKLYRKLLINVLLVSFLLIGCSKDSSGSEDNNGINPPKTEKISAVDFSWYPDIKNFNIQFKNKNNQIENPLSILKKNGVNTIRLRLWHSPENENSSFQQVKSFANELKSEGFKIWLTVHYSDTWADPGKQVIPKAWENLSFEHLKDSVYNYTSKIITEINPEIIQIGNEINSGLIFPHGNINNNENQFIELVKQGHKAVRDNSTSTKTMIHFAGIEGSDWFFNKFTSLDYDYIGLSYYPKWHGKDLTKLKTTLTSLSTNFNKEILIAETSYPFTLGWNDWTNNIIGSKDQILTQFPATPQGQKNFMKEIKNILLSTDNGIGFCYWGAEWVAYKGNESTECSTWENQAIFDFNFKELPVLEEFNLEN